jgi:hypothetical protein
MQKYYSSSKSNNFKVSELEDDDVRIEPNLKNILQKNLDIKPSVLYKINMEKRKNPT